MSDLRSEASDLEPLVVKTKVAWKFLASSNTRGYELLASGAMARGSHLIDLQLDHVLGNKVGQAYGHDKLIEERQRRGKRHEGDREGRRRTHRTAAVQH